MSRVRPPAPRRPSRVPLALALAVGVGLPLLWAWSESQAPAEVAAAPVATAAATPAPPPTAAPATPAPAPAAAGVETTARTLAARPAAPQIPRLRDPEGDQTPDVADFVNPGEVPTMAEVIQRLRAAGVAGGLAAFNPPGTRPPLEGNAVPEGAVLPPGYVRHHQFTDDGQRIEPILLFSPEHPAVVAALQAAGANASSGSLQARDLVVPASQLPAGIPERRVVVPPAAEPGK